MYSHGEEFGKRKRMDKLVRSFLKYKQQISSDTTDNSNIGAKKDDRCCSDDNFIFNKKMKNTELEALANQEL